MPINITLPPPNNLIGPGIPAILQSGVIGPMPTGTIWKIRPSSDLEGLNSNFEFRVPWNGAGLTFIPFYPDATTQVQQQQSAFKDGDTTHLVVTIENGTTVEDSGTATGEWSSTAGKAYTDWLQFINLENQSYQQTDRDLANQTNTNTSDMLNNWSQYESVTLPSLQDALNNIIGSVTATISSAAGAVSQTLGQIFSGKTLDKLTTVDLVGITCDPIAQQIGGGGFYGLEVKITTVPDWVAFTAPGETWTPQDLAVLRIERGGSEILRQGIHTLSHTVYPLPGIPTVTMEVDVPFVPPDYVVYVDWGMGVCGQLLLLELP